MVGLAENPGKREEAPPAEVRLRVVRGGMEAAGDTAPVAAASGEPAERPRVIDLRRARARGKAGPAPRGAAAAGSDEDTEDEGPLEPDWKDILALIIATFEVLGPFLLMLFGAAGLVYLFLKLIAH